MATKRKKKKVDADADEAEVEVAERERPLLDRITDLRMDISDDQSAVARLLDIMIDEAGGNSDEVHEELVAARASDGGDADADVDDWQLNDTTAGSTAI